jgi:hypothetical protein
MNRKEIRGWGRRSAVEEEYVWRGACRELWFFLSFLSGCASTQGEVNHKNGGKLWWL